MSTATRSSPRKPAAEPGKGFEVPRVVVAATLLLVALVMAIGYTGGCGSNAMAPSPGAFAPASEDLIGGAGTAAVAGGGSSPGGGSAGSIGELSPDELDQRVALQLGMLDTDRERDIYRFLERNGAGTPIRSVSDVEKFVMSLARLRGHESPLVRRGALAALGRLPEASMAAEPFVVHFDDPDPRVRREAVVGRTRQGVARHWKFLVPLVRDPDPSVRSALCYALGDVAEAEAQAALLTLFTDPSDDVVAAAAIAIGRRQTTAPAPAVMNAVRSDRSRVRLAAVEVLRQARTAECVAPLLVLLEDPVWDVRREAIRALASFTGPESAGVLGRIEAVAYDTARSRTERFEALQELAHTEESPHLDRVHAVAASDPDPALRLAAARTLLSRNDPRACAALAELVDVAEGAKCDFEDKAFVRTTSAQTLRDVSGAVIRDEDAESWKRLVPGLEARVKREDFSYQPDYLVERW